MPQKPKKKTPSPTQRAAQRQHAASSIGWTLTIVAVVGGVAIFLGYNLGLLSEPTAVTLTGGTGLLAMFYYGLHGFFSRGMGSPLAIAALGVVAGLWMVAIGYPFYRALNPGTPMFGGELKRGASVTVPLSGKAGTYDLQVTSQFTPIQEHINRTATYQISLDQGQEQHLLEGSFNQEWRNQRVGMGRRATSVPILHTSPDAREVIESRDGHDLKLTLAELSDGVRDTLQLRVYAEPVPRWALYVVAVAALLGSIVVDACRFEGEQEGLMIALTVSALAGLEAFIHSVPHTPGFPQLVVALLAGAIAGALARLVLQRAAIALRSYLPAHA